MEVPQIYVLIYGIIALGGTILAILIERYLFSYIRPKRKKVEQLAIARPLVSDVSHEKRFEMNDNSVFVVHQISEHNEFLQPRYSIFEDKWNESFFLTILSAENHEDALQRYLLHQQQQGPVLT